MTIYYLHNSAAFTVPPFKYHTAKYKKAVKKAGGTDIHVSQAYGWCNQPEVVCFTATDEVLKEIERALSALPPFGGYQMLPSPLIHTKDWSDDDKES